MNELKSRRSAAANELGWFEEPDRELRTVGEGGVRGRHDCMAEAYLRRARRGQNNAKAPVSSVSAAQRKVD